MRRLGFETLVPRAEEAVRGGCRRVLRETAAPAVSTSFQHRPPRKTVIRWDLGFP
jgi:hypothetical protein